MAGGMPFLLCPLLARMYIWLVKVQPSGMDHRVNNSHNREALVTELVWECLYADFIISANCQKEENLYHINGTDIWSFLIGKIYPRMSLDSACTAEGVSSIPPWGN